MRVGDLVDVDAGGGEVLGHARHDAGDAVHAGADERDLREPAVRMVEQAERVDDLGGAVQDGLRHREDERVADRREHVEGDAGIGHRAVHARLRGHVPERALLRAEATRMRAMPVDVAHGGGDAAGR